MKKQIAIALAALSCALAGTAAHAGNVYWSVGISAPPIGTVISNGPAYGAVYAPAPVVYEPQPEVIYAPRPVIYRPGPVVVSSPYYRPAPVVYGGYGGGYYRSGYYYGRDWREHRNWRGEHDGRGDRDWHGDRDGRGDWHGDQNHDGQRDDIRRHH
jgi:hypothetical protein